MSRLKIVNNLYRCTKCLIFKPKDEYHKSAKEIGIREVCKFCRTIERRQRYLASVEKEAEYQRNYKLNNPQRRAEQSIKSSRKLYKKFRLFLNKIKDVECLDCKIKYPPPAMDFDHRDPSNKSFNISEARHINKNLLLKEIRKCDIVCANCHRIREASRRSTIKEMYYAYLINPYKEDPCMDCNKKYPSFVMDFDHRDPSTKCFHISKPKFRTKNQKQELIDEIMKCDVVCANCHRIRTFVKEDHE